MVDDRPPWDVLLIGGAIGVGKTSVSYRLARHFSVGITEIDDFQVVLERMTDAERYPELHSWRRDPQAFLNLAENEILAFMIRYGEVMADVLEYVIGHHVEPDEAQIARNYTAREGEEQPGRARLSWRYSEWLREEAERLGVPVVPARPWDTVLARCLDTIADLQGPTRGDMMSNAND